MRLTAPILASAMLLAGIGAAVAQNAIGEMAQIQGQVASNRAGQLKNGSSVVQNEVVSAAAASSGRVAFHDLTSLVIGPNSSVTLDKFVFDNDGKVTSASLNMTRGAFRLISGGNTPSKNIGVKTPTATIGLRGTVVDVKVQPGREIVWLRQGATTVCRGQQCVPLDRVGEGVYITDAGVSSPSTAPAAEFDFDVLTNQLHQLHVNHLGNPGSGAGPESSPSSSPSSSGYGNYGG